MVNQTAAVDKKLSSRMQGVRHFLSRKTVLLVAAICFLLWSALYPQRFMTLWLTADQQGRILFELGHYDKAARHFSNPLWNSIAYYGNEDFRSASILFSQYGDANAMLARGNALAHARDYVPAVKVYKQILQQFPDNATATSAASTNISIVQALIDANQMLSESQMAEQGDMNKEDDNGAKSSDGDERAFFDAQPQQQLSADALLQDPALTQMWLRQVQKDPSNFLSIKFQMQLEQQQKKMQDAGDYAQEREE